MNAHEPGRLDKCPICGKRFTSTDRDVKLYRLEFTRMPLPRGMRKQTIWYRIHDECASGYQQRAWTLPVASLRSFAMRGVCLIDDSGRGRYEYE